MSFDPDSVDLACDDHAEHWLHLADEDARRRSLDRLLREWDRILADELGEPVADLFTRMTILDTALDDYAHRADVALGIPQH
jgi:hypothetical protein